MVLARHSAWKAHVSMQPMQGSPEDCVLSAGTGFCPLFLLNLIQFPVTVLLQMHLAKSCSSQLGKANSSTSEGRWGAWPLGGGLLPMLSSAGCLALVWGLQHVEIIPMFFTHMISFMDRCAILRRILKFWPMLSMPFPHWAGQCLAIHLSLATHPKRCKDQVYNTLYILVAFSFNLRATCKSRKSYFPFCKPVSLASSPQAAHGTDFCAETEVKEKTKWKYSWDFPKCSH